MMERRPLVVEVWSDVVCPFCYLGHARFARALASWPRGDEVEVTWRSFQLNPGTRTDPHTSIHDHLAREKGIERAQARRMHDHLTTVGRLEGVTYDFDRVVVANTFRAHQLTHFARAHQRQGELMERLFHAYFRDGRNIDDADTLVGLAGGAGLDTVAAAAALADDAYAAAVRADMDEAHRLGIHGVPFFVLNRRLAVSGAQAPAVFIAALDEAAAPR